MPAADATYSIRPSFKEKFRPVAVKALISTVLSERLKDKQCAAKSPGASGGVRAHPCHARAAGTMPSRRRSGRARLQVRLSF